MDQDNNEGTNQHEPTVLEWFISLLKLRPLPIPEEAAPKPVPVETPKISEEALPAEPVVPAPPLAKEIPAFRLKAAHIRLPAALLLAFIAQFRLEQRAGDTVWSVIPYLLAMALIGWAFWEGDLPKISLSTARRKIKPIRVRLPWLIAAAFLSLFTFLASGDNRFSLSILVTWSGALICTILSLWEGELKLRLVWEKVRARFPRKAIRLKIDGWSLLVLTSLLLVTYFRFTQLPTVPYEMTSDQAEKLLDVVDVLNGKYSIYFPRNTGREAIQFYLAAATDKLLGTGVSFITLKLGTALIGLLTLPYIYLFAREVGGREVGLAALLLAGVAYWPNTISRMGLRFPLYPLFTAPVFYHMARGLRLKQRNHLLLAGLFAGLALHGYSPARVVPLALIVGVIIYFAHRIARGQRGAVIGWLVAAGLIALVIFLPLFRVALKMPDLFMLRTLTRMGSSERPLPGPALKILLSNIWRGLTMFGWDNGGIWVISIPHRPALDWVTGALFHLGTAFVAVRYIKRRNWLDLFILLSIPLLMLPSTLSLAFPDENPAPNRAAGAIVPVFTLAALPLAIIPAWVRDHWKNPRAHKISLLIVAGMFLLSANINFRLVFDDFSDQYRRGAWNTSDVGGVIRSFAESIGTFDTAHVVPYPHWMDTRLVGMIAGKPTVDYALWPDNFESLLSEERAQMLILHPNDVESLDSLNKLFPTGEVSRRTSELEGKDFMIYFVPPANRTDQILPPEPET